MLHCYWMKRSYYPFNLFFIKLATDVGQTQKSVIGSLARQVSLQQLYVEEQTRANGDSGLKLTRLGQVGSRSYYSNTYVGMSEHRP